MDDRRAARREGNAAPGGAEMRLQLECWMRRSSIAISIGAGLAMLVGLAEMLFAGSLLRFQSEPALALSALLHPGRTSMGLFATSSGIVLLSLLPGLRVLLAAALYAGRRAWADTIVALLVLAELVVSLLTGRS